MMGHGDEAQSVVSGLGHRQREVEMLKDVEKPFTDSLRLILKVKREK